MSERKIMGEFGCFSIGIKVMTLTNTKHSTEGKHMAPLKAADIRYKSLLMRNIENEKHP